MKSTGVCPRETLSWPRLAAKRSLAALGGFGLAMAGMMVGSSSAFGAGDYDPTQPRVEEVLDTDGSVWKVLIVPRPLYQPGLPHPAHCILPPAPVPSVKGKIEAPAPEKALPEKIKGEPKKAPAQAQKEATTKAKLLKQTEPVALQKSDEKPAKKESKEPAKEAVKKDEVKPANPKPAEPNVEPPFGVEIVPRISYRALSPAEACCLGNEEPLAVNPASYAWVYASIPFLRSEYVANPSYRHEATMEILFGKLRPTVVHKHPGQPRPHETQFPYENDIIRPYSYYSMGPGAGYGRGPLPYGMPGAYGVNYNFYYPMPTVYRAY